MLVAVSPASAGKAQTHGFRRIWDQRWEASADADQNLPISIENLYCEFENALGFDFRFKWLNR